MRHADNVVSSVLISPAECMGEKFSELTIGIFQFGPLSVPPNEVWV